MPLKFEAHPASISNWDVPQKSIGINPPAKTSLYGRTYWYQVHTNNTPGIGVDSPAEQPTQ